MSKKAGKNHNPNRPSRNSPVGKRNDPQINWARYNRSRRSEGRRYTVDVGGGRHGARDPVQTAGQARLARLGHTGCHRQVGGEALPLGAGHFDRYPEDLERCEMYRPYSRAQYQLHVLRIKPKVQQQILTRMAGDGCVHGTKIVDSSGYSIARYKEWQNAKYGKISV